MLLKLDLLMRLFRRLLLPCFASKYFFVCDVNANTKYFPMASISELLPLYSLFSDQLMTPSLSLMVIQLTVQLAWIWIDRLKSLVWRFSRKKKKLCQRMRLQNFISNMKDLNTLINWLNLWLGIVNTKAQFRYFLSSTAAVKDLKWSWSFFFLNKAKI